MNIKGTIQEISNILKGYSPTPLIDAELLLSFVTQKPKEYFFTYPEKNLTKIQTEKINRLIEKRKKGYPIAYLIGEKWFYGNKFFVNKNTLTPRPETELMVDEAVNLITRENKPFTLIDVGTGTACIPISIALETKKKNISKINIIAIDISKKTLMVANKNILFHKLSKKISTIHGDLITPILNNTKKFNLKKNIIITANLPYLTPEQIKTSKSIQKEPKLALVAGKDGLKYYKILFNQIKKLCLKRYRLYVLCEIDPSQTSKIKQLIKNELPNSEIYIKKDYAKNNRLVMVLPPNTIASEIF